MRSHQQKFLADIEAAAKEYGLELVVDFAYGNTGKLTVSFEDSYEPIVLLKFWFYDDGSEFNGLPNPERADRADEKTRNGWYLKPPEFPKIIKAIRNKMAQAVNERRTQEIAELTK